MGNGLEAGAVYYQRNTTYWRKMRNQKPAAEERSEGPLYRGDPQRRASGLEGPTVSPSSRCLELYLREREPNAEGSSRGEMCSEDTPQSRGVQDGLDLNGDT